MGRPRSLPEDRREAVQILTNIAERANDLIRLCAEVDGERIDWKPRGTKRIDKSWQLLELAMAHDVVELD